MTNVDSPETKLTTYSPEQLRGPFHSHSKRNATMSLGGISNFSIAPTVDPFIGPDYSVQPPQFSPGCLNFQPFGLGHSDQGISGEASVGSVDYPGLPTPKTASHPNKFRVGEGASPISPLFAEKANSSLSRGNVETMYPAPKSRAFAVEGVSPTLSHLAVAGLFSRREFESIQGPDLSGLSSIGRFVVGFADFRDTQKALEKLRIIHPAWRIIPLTAREHAQESKHATECSSDFEGHVSITVFLNDQRADLDMSSIYSTVQGIARNFGAINAFKAASLQIAKENDFFVEYCDTRDAANAVSVLNGACIEDLFLETKHIRPDVESCPGVFFRQANHGRDEFSPTTSSRKQQPETPIREHHALVLSPTGRSTVPMEDISDLMDLLSPTQKRVGLEHDGSHFTDQRLKHPQNVVDSDRIRLGLDVRTTIMLRNIPNKVDLSLLKTIIDETSFGKYDFMYLRIDFANNCNVGYAFINFEDPIDIIDFVQARAGRTWNCFNSDKVAEVSYATIQGRDCLVQKFRNSSVMLEDPSFRPKLFYTGKGPLAGTEEPFPGPNNISKMRRSVENAEQVGLFAPRITRDVRRGQGMRSSASQASFARKGLSQRQLLLNATPETSPVSRRDF
ncbi:Meiosis protein mei2 [Talaromyces islandicus]|uniref:Meiosis protein mei2 n=1 Tax=Talaromyces islandicus TaxID=28573 RepID=A0A0U1LZL6_TALIS|nr:Meiosis protein mei2 [Talaromyces islandicus]